MTARSANDIQGFEFDWLATDAEGHVGFFSTAGGGYAPQAFLEDVDAHAAAIDAVLCLPPSTRCARPTPPAGMDTWQQMAERGVFAFDADVHGGPYRLVAAPEHPIRLAALPSIAAVVVRGTALPHLNLGGLRVVTAAMLQSP